MKLNRTSFSLIPLAALLLASCGERQDEPPAPGAGEVEAVGRELADIEEGHILATNSPIPAEGSVRTTETTFSMSEGTMTMRMGDEVMEGSIETHATRTERLVGLSPDSARWTLESETENTVVEMMGERVEKPDVPAALLGQAVLIERDASGAWSIRLEEGEADEEVEASLTELLNSLVARSGRSVDIETFGETHRMPGESWELDVSEIYDTILDIESPEGTLAVSFDRVEEGEAGDVAVLSFSMNVSGSDTGEDASEIRISATGQIRRCLVELTDLENTFAGQLSGSFEAMPGMMVTIEGLVEIQATTTISAVE